MITLQDGRHIYSCSNYSQHGMGASDYASILVAANTESEALGLAIQHADRNELRADSWSASPVDFEDNGNCIIDADFATT